jgi:hypothetical protein
MSQAVAMTELRHRADSLLEMEPPTVVAKLVLPPSGDFHDYLSIAPYWWPNPETADGLPWVERDGHYNPRTLDIPDKPGLYALIELVRVLGRAYQVLGRAAYAEKAAACLRAWFLAPATRMNPNLNFGQSVPGRADGRPAGLIETREIGRLLDGVGMIEGSSAWSAGDTESLREWVRRFLAWMSASPLARAERSATNNHATWYLAQSAAMSEFAGDRSAAATQVADGRLLIARQIASDGSQPEELRRANSRHYYLFNLLGFCRLATLGDRLGVDLWGDLGAAFERLFADWDAWPAPTLPSMPSDEAEYAEVQCHVKRHRGKAACAAS